MLKAFKNGRIYTANKSMLWASSMVMDGEDIVFVGEEDEEFEELAKSAEVIDLQGKNIVPGFIDAHTHPGQLAESYWHYALPYTDDLDETLDYIRKHSEAHPELPYLFIENYSVKLFGTEEEPRKEILDRAVSDKPVLCLDTTGHQQWVNSKWLELAEVTKDTSDPVPGISTFVRDEEGNPIGSIKEYAWVYFLHKLCENLDWYVPVIMTPEMLEKSIKYFEAHGITGIAEGFYTEEESHIKSMYELDMAGKLHMYYDGIVRFWRYEELPEKIKTLRRYQKEYTSKHVKINTIKLFMDASHENGTATLLKPQSNDPEGKANFEPQMDVDELTDSIYLCNSEGLDIHIHIAGDGAFRMAVDATENAKNRATAENEEWTTQVILAHCMLIDPADYDRTAALGITINFAPHWSAGYFVDEGINYLGRERWDRQYDYNRFAENGTLVTLSSDIAAFYEAHRADPYYGMQTAITRVDIDAPLDPKKYPGSMRPSEDAKMTREVLMQEYTINGAKQMHQDDIVGSLEKGKKANFSIVSGDIFDVPDNEIKDIKFEKVYFEGEVIYEI